MKIKMKSESLFVGTRQTGFPELGDGWVLGDELGQCSLRLLDLRRHCLGCCGGTDVRGLRVDQLLDLGYTRFNGVQGGKQRSRRRGGVGHDVLHRRMGL
jgi:hypothetical protein